MTLANAILAENISQVRRYLGYESVNDLDEYGFTPLIEAAIVNNLEISKLLLDQGAYPNQPDVTGGTALQWASENNNLALAKLLLEHRANPNAFNFSGQPVLTMPMLRRQKEMRQLLIRAGADPLFAQDYINTKLLGHMFELIGMANIVDPDNQFVEVNFEGFILEVTIGILADALAHFQNHFASRQLRRYSGLIQFIVDTMLRSLVLVKYQQYRVDIRQHQNEITQLLKEDPLLIPIGYEGHAITFIRYGDLWVKCDRREDSRLYDNIMIYRMQRPEELTIDFLQTLIYEKQDSQFINHDLDQILGLTPLTELKIEAQISGNCSWANVEAAIPTLFFLGLLRFNHEKDIAYYKTLALNFFHRFREWNKERALDYCIKSYQQGDVIRKACKAEILAAILFQRCSGQDSLSQERLEKIMAVLVKSPFEYILKNYLRVYYYEGYTEEGKRFAELLKAYGVV